MGNLLSMRYLANDDAKRSASPCGDRHAFGTRKALGREHTLLAIAFRQVLDEGSNLVRRRALSRKHRMDRSPRRLELCQHTLELTGVEPLLDEPRRQNGETGA